MARRSLVGGLTLLAAAALAPPAASETWFVLENGRTVLGDIIEATRNTLMVRRDDGGLQPLARSQVERVETTTADGEKLVGRLGDWRDGRLGLDVGAERVWIAEARVVEREPVPAAQKAEPEPAQAQGAAPARRPEPDTERAPAAAAQKAEPEPAQAQDTTPARRPEPDTERAPAAAAQKAEPEPAQAQDTAPARTAKAGTPPAQGAGRAPAPPARTVPQAEAAASPEPDPAQPPAADHARAALAFQSAPADSDGKERQALNRTPVRAPDAGREQGPGAEQDPKLAALHPGGTALPVLSAHPGASEVLEKVGEVVFEVELSRASDRPVDVIYSTVDGTASGGTHYKPRQGILTLKPGETAATLRVALIDNDESEGDKKFHLFITTKAGQAEVADKWVPVVIKDDDGPAW